MQNPSITDLLIATLGSSRSSRRFRSILKEREFRRYKQASVHVALSRLKNRGYLCKDSKKWQLTTAGKMAARHKYLFSYFPSPFKEDSEHITILAFDIPESDRRIRAWLRNQIKIFGYVMLQKSLWIGPGPLPPVFIKRLKELKIR